MIKKILIFLFLSYLFLIVKNSVFAADPHLFLSPTSGNYSGDFNIEVRIDTGSQAVGGADVILEFPKNLLSVQRVIKGTVFSEVFSSIKNNEGKLLISAYFPYTESEKSYTGTNGLIATISFKPLANGTASVNFVCNPNSTNESNIVEKIKSKDIIVCASNVNGSYNLTATTNNENLTSPTLIPTPTPTLNTSSPYSSSPTPTIPVTGSNIQTTGFLGIGIFILLAGLLLAF
jgi:hypothetical protein